MTSVLSMTSPFPELVSRLANRLPKGETRTALGSVSFLKVITPGELVPEVQKPVVSLILQGEKRLSIGRNALHYRVGDTYAAAIDLPTRIEILGCSRTRPYIAMTLRPDPTLLADLAQRSEPMAPTSGTRAFAVHPADKDLLDAYRRLLQTLERAGDLDVMGPLIEKEILFRLLQSPQDPILRKLVANGGRHAGIAKAIARIRTEYTGPLRAADLASASGMSVPTFYRRFKAETGMSPLQYRTRLRLYEARRRLHATSSHVARLAFELGYDSPSQFSREYAREFGVPPTRDAGLMRARVLSG
jgi:AraC-like DNA-binding protein